MYIFAILTEPSDIKKKEKEEKRFSPPILILSDFSGDRVTRSLVLCVCFVDSCFSV